MVLRSLADDRRDGLPMEATDDLGGYCRAIEAHLCRVNGGHLIRIVGPAFDLAKRWYGAGVPLKIVLRGIDRRAARANRRPAAVRRPLRLEFCDADVREVLEEWRRAIGLALSGADRSTAPEGVTPEAGTGTAGPEPRAGRSRRGPSLAHHFERVALRLSTFLATSDLGEALRGTVAAIAADVEALRREAEGRRGADRHAIAERLEALDRRLLEAVAEQVPRATWEEAQAEAGHDLESYRTRVSPTEFQQLRDRAARHLLRDRLGLPRLTWR